MSEDNKQLSLDTIARIIGDLTGKKTYVQRIYLDYGAGLMGDNIIVEKDDEGLIDDYQLLSIADLDRVKNGSFTWQDILDECEVINRRGW